MKRLLVLVAVGFACVATATAHAQEQTRPRAVMPTAVPDQAAPVGTRTVMGTVETRVTPDRPYSAEAVSDTTRATMAMSGPSGMRSL